METPETMTAAELRQHLLSVAKSRDYFHGLDHAGNAHTQGLDELLGFIVAEVLERLDALEQAAPSA